MNRLPSRVSTAVLTYIGERLAASPQRLSKELGGGLAGLRSARNGDYRILFRLDPETVWVIRVVHRAHAGRDDDACRVSLGGGRTAARLGEH